MDNNKAYITICYFQEYMAKARDYERELRTISIEKARAEALREVAYDDVTYVHYIWRNVQIYRQISTCQSATDDKVLISHDWILLP